MPNVKPIPELQNYSEGFALMPWLFLALRALRERKEP